MRKPTPEQRAMLQAALKDLFEAHATQDELLRPKLVASAEKQMVFLADLHGLPELEEAA